VFSEMTVSAGIRRLALGLSLCVCALGVSLVNGAGTALADGSWLFGAVGSEAGQVGEAPYIASGMAIDEQSGDVYVADNANVRIDVFNQSGAFLLAWGGGVATGASESQVCTTSCRQGNYGGEAHGAGEFCIPEAVAVDNDALSSSQGDVYVDDPCNHRVQKFSATGEFLLMFGGHVNKNGTDVCIAGEECQEGASGTGNGEFSEGSRSRSRIAVGPEGDVYVADRERVDVFLPGGAWKENISLSTQFASSTAEDKFVSALAVNSAGDLFVSINGLPGVHELGPSGTELSVKIDEAGNDVQALVAEKSGDVLVSDAGGQFEPKSSLGETRISKYTPSGEELYSFGTPPLVATSAAMAPDLALNEVLIYGADEFSNESFNDEYEQIGVWKFQPPAPGPLLEPSSALVATPEPRGAATFAGSLNPEGGETKYHIEYVTQARFETGGYAEATSTSTLTLAPSFADEPVSVKASGLTPGATYHWRVVASNANGTITGPEETFQEDPPAQIEAAWATEVTATSADIHAQIDPLGAATTYRLEYGTSTMYGHVIAGNVGEGTVSLAVLHELEELEPGRLYHYRLVATNEVGTAEGTDHTFTTQQTVGGAAQLPDGREWELVSPPDKHGALIENDELAQAASDGSGIFYTASAPIGEGIDGHVGQNIHAASAASLISRRNATGGWTTRDISPAQTLTPEGTSGGEMANGTEFFYRFTPNLSMGLFEPGFSLAPQAVGITEKTLYLRDNEQELFLPLVNPTNVPAGTHFGPTSGPGWEQEQMQFLAATSDVSHVLFGSGLALTPDAVREETSGGLERNIYEWNEGRLQLVNILPGGQTEPGARFSAGTGSGAYPSSNDGPNPSAFSQNGRWVVFHYTNNGITSYYVRDMVEKKTYPFGQGAVTRFQAMSSDGSRIFYIEKPTVEKEYAGSNVEMKGELYLFEPAVDKTVNLTADHLDGEHSAGVANSLAGTSEDGSTVYFIATGVLAKGATKGGNNLYVLHEEKGSWSTSFIATLSKEDEKDWRPESTFAEVESLVTRVSPDGNYLSFMSNNPLTGYDNRDAVSGMPDEEAYLYDLDKNSLACVSCDPSGARPHGLLEQFRGFATKSTLLDYTQSWTGENNGREKERGHWLTGALAPAWHVNNYNASYQPRSLLDSGRLFFESTDPLVPQDTNGLTDVYEYEPVGAGDCNTESSLFDAHIDGCVGLISSGQSATESEFMDASETGDDVFFVTASQLVPEDQETSYALYDAHVCSAAVPCRTAPILPPPCDSGDSCKAAPSPQPAIFGPTPSVTFSGTGNVVEEAKKSVVKKHKAKPKKKKKRGKRVKSKSKKTKKGRKSTLAHVRKSGRGK
jgi:hypothetical protein